MNFVTYDIKSVTKDDLKTEIIYTVKSAFVGGHRLILLNFTADEEKDAVAARSTAVLKSLKRQRDIEFFAKVGELSSAESMEAVYLLNKIPTLADEIDTTSNGIIVKI